eukprot:4015295-Amphidinium_carterae.1
MHRVACSTLASEVCALFEGSAALECWINWRFAMKRTALDMRNLWIRGKSDLVTSALSRSRSYISMDRFKVFACCSRQGRRFQHTQYCRCIDQVARAQRNATQGVGGCYSSEERIGHNKRPKRSGLTEAFSEQQPDDTPRFFGGL